MQMRHGYRPSDLCGQEASHLSEVGWMAPAAANLDGENIVWVPGSRRLKSGPDMLVQFIELATGDAAGILKFFKKWGPLGVHLGYSEEPRSYSRRTGQPLQKTWQRNQFAAPSWAALSDTLRDAGLDNTQSEPLGTWRFWSSAFLAVLTIHNQIGFQSGPAALLGVLEVAEIARGLPPDGIIISRPPIKEHPLPEASRLADQWAVILGTFAGDRAHQFCSFEDYWGLTSERQSELLGAVLNIWLDQLAQVKFRVCIGSSPTFTYHVDTLFAALLMQLCAAVTDCATLALCAYCWQPIPPGRAKRRRRAGVKACCGAKECRNKAVAAAARRYYARKKASQTVAAPMSRRNKKRSKTRHKHTKDQSA